MQRIDESALLQADSPDTTIVEPQDDSELVALCLAGDQSAWVLLIGRYSRLIYSVPLRFGFSNQVADEIFQEVCLLLLENLGELRDVTRLSAWLVTTTKRKSIQYWRTHQKVQLSDIEAIEELGEYDEVDEQLDLIAQKHLIQEAIGLLAQRDRDLLTALFLADPPWTYERIAAELGIPTGSIGPNRRRSLNKLRAAIIRLEKVGC